MLLYLLPTLPKQLILHLQLMFVLSKKLKDLLLSYLAIRVGVTISVIVLVLVYHGAEALAGLDVVPSPMLVAGGDEAEAGRYTLFLLLPLDGDVLIA